MMNNKGPKMDPWGTPNKSMNYLKPLDGSPVGAECYGV